MMSALDKQVGGSHYKEFAVQPCVLMNTFSGPASHILSYIVRTKGADDLDKAIHWCELAMENGMQDYRVDLYYGGDQHTAHVAPNMCAAAIWCWRNGIPADSHQAKAILALEVGDYLSAKIHIERMKEERLC